jgi:hypothetical protein
MASQPSSSTLTNGLRDLNRFITTHNSSGEAVFSNALPDGAKWQELDHVNFFLGYTTRKFPVSLNPEEAPEDIASYEKDLENPPGLCVSGGKFSTVPGAYTYV